MARARRLVRADPPPPGTDRWNRRCLSPAQSRRPSELFGLQADRRLSEEEQQELDALVAEYGRQFGERTLRALAAQRGISVDTAWREADAPIAAATARWAALERNASTTGRQRRPPSAGAERRAR